MYVYYNLTTEIHWPGKLWGHLRICMYFHCRISRSGKGLYNDGDIKRPLGHCPSVSTPPRPLTTCRNRNIMCALYLFLNILYIYMRRYTYLLICIHTLILHTQHVRTSINKYEASWTIQPFPCH